jgi:acetyl-CoA carboxylase carboxyltransferase component
MMDNNKGRISYIDNERAELARQLDELRARQRQIEEQRLDLENRKRRAIEQNSQQIAICQKFIDEVGDDAEARYYLERFMHQLHETCRQIEMINIERW